MSKRIPEDVSIEVRSKLGDVPSLQKEGSFLTSNPLPSSRKVRFNDEPIFIEPKKKEEHEYNILQNIKEQKANVTIGQLLHDNFHYQKLIQEAWTKRRKRRFKLPVVAVNFS